MDRENSEISEPKTSESYSDDSMVCYCFGLTANKLRESYTVYGSLDKLEKQTKVGTACTGCKALLFNMFGEAPSDPYSLEEERKLSSFCKKPGYKVMKGLVVANDHFDSRIVSSNAVAPQFGECDSTSMVTYALLDQAGKPVVQGKRELKTNEAFTFTTEGLSIPRPFVGMFILHFDRSNMGASRFNIQWYGKKAGVSATHENATTGRPKVTLPIIFDKAFQEGPNTVYLGLMNPHDHAVPCQLIVKDVDTGVERRAPAVIDALNSFWIDTNQSIFRPALEEKPEGRFTFRLESQAGMGNAITVYFFIHNKGTDLWTAQHL